MNGVWQLQGTLVQAHNPIPPDSPHQLESFEQAVEPGLYHLQVNDAAEDGICCVWGRGFITITDADSVVWSSSGDKFSSTLNVFIWVDSDGTVKPVDHVPGIGYVLVTPAGKIRSATSKGAVLSTSATVEVVVREE